MATITRLSRRGLLGASLGAAALSGFGVGSSPSAALAAVNPDRKRVLRLAHIADTHIQPERGAAEGVAAMIAHLNAQPDKPDLVVHTGDIIMDGFAQTQARTRLQWNLWKSASVGLKAPIKYALGNHDIWGWNKTRSESAGTEPQWGKRWACDELGLTRPYHSFDANGWHFIALDSIRPFTETAYRAFIESEQMEWVRGDLASTTLPTCILSHVPILSITSFINGAADPATTQPTTRPAGGSVYRPERGDIHINGALQHGDVRQLKSLFAKHPHVKLALSGHTHLIDNIAYNGVTYLCGGAVSANWWKGKHQDECDFGYNLIDLYDDGSIDREYVTYGWIAKPLEPGSGT